MDAEHSEEVKKQYSEYIFKVYNSRKDEWKGEILKEYFKECFEDFSLEMFKNMLRELRRNLRQHSSKNDLYVPMGVGIKTMTAPFEVLTKNPGEPFPINSHTEEQRPRTMQLDRASVSNSVVDLQKKATALAYNINKLSSRNYFNVQDDRKASNTRYENTFTNTKDIGTTSFSSIGAIP